jgi:phage recombination protein Bet
MAAVRDAMKTSLYPGADDKSVDMILAYCTARGLDVMTKPVHLVPMWIPERKRDGKVISPAGMRDVVMPGIGTYRIDAHRTGEYAGQDECEFGPPVTRTFTDGSKRVEVTFPEWARVTVYRMMRDVRVAYSAKVYWLETYSTAGRDTDAPNAMWKKRPFGQLEKCAEALALRKGFPEAVGNEPTAEEMEGKAFIDGEAHRVDSTGTAGSGLVAMPQAKVKTDAPKGDAPKADAKPDAGATKPADEPIDAEFTEAAQPGIHVADGPKRMLMVKAKQAGFVSEEELLAKFPSITPANLNDVLAALRAIQDKNDGAE